MSTRSLSLPLAVAVAVAAGWYLLTPATPDGALVPVDGGVYAGDVPSRPAGADDLPVEAVIADLVAAREASGTPPALPDGVDATWWSEARAKMAAGVHQLHTTDRGLRLANPRTDLEAVLDEDGAATLSLRHPGALGPASGWDGQVGLRTAAVGRGDDVRPLGEAPFRSGACDPADSRRDIDDACLARAEARQGPVTTWLTNPDDGLVQGFTVDELAGEGDLVIEVAVAGAVAGINPDGSIGLGAPAAGLQGRDLRAWDAKGDALSVIAEVTGEGFRLRVDVADAAWPVTVDPTWTPWSWTAKGWDETWGASDSDEDWFGWSIAGGGDINGDGYDDVVVGAPFYDGSYSEGGRVVFFYGSATGLGTSGYTSFYPSATGDFMGQSVAILPDVSGDGRDEVVVGIPGANIAGTDDGAVKVYALTASGPVVLATFAPGVSGAMFGGALESPGDLNGDGYPDLVVGSDRYSNGQTNEGAFYVYFGATPYSASWAVRTESDQAEARLGSGDFAAMGDMNRDGYPELGVGTYRWDEGALVDAGRTRLYAGTPSGLQLTWTLPGDQANARCGAGLGGGGDVDGDGDGDIAIGCPRYTRAGRTVPSGYVLVLAGNGALTPNRLITNVFGAQDNEALGDEVDIVGDVDDDGYADIAISSVNYYSSNQGYEGLVQIISGGPTVADMRVLAQWESNLADSGFGSDLVGVGDVNGDGLADVAVSGVLVDGRWGFSYGTAYDQGQVWAYYGSRTGIGRLPSGLAGFGAEEVRIVGDMNSDGYDDLAIGDPLYDNGQTDEGLVWLYAGGPDGLATTPLAWWEQDQAGARFGASVTATDMDLDGHRELIVGSPGWDNGQTDEGRFVGYRGTATGPQTAPQFSWEPSVTNAQLGTHLEPADNFDGSGWGAFAASMPYYDVNFADDGAVGLFRGEGAIQWPGGPSRVLTQSVTNAQAGIDFGTGDVNGDGLADVIVGARSGTVSGTTYTNTEGVALLFLGGPTPNRPADAAWTTGQSGASGWRVGVAGDVNNDGLDDMIIGIPSYDSYPGNNWINDGYARLVLGSASPTLGSSWFSMQGYVTTGAGFGTDVGAAGDLNGDGRDDFFVQSAGGFYSNDTRLAVYKSESWGADGYNPWWAMPSGMEVRGASGGGDLNGDGYDDLVISVDRAWGAYGDDGLYVMYGGPNGLWAGRCRDGDGDGDCAAYDPDDDGDGFLDAADSAAYDALRCADADGDGCDDCSGGAGPNAATDGPDYDADGLCDWPGDPCPTDPGNDPDGDGDCAAVDRCPGAPDAAADPDLDGVCGAADLCVGVDATGDSDGDGTCDDGDVCPGADEAPDDAQVALDAFPAGALASWPRTRTADFVQLVAGGDFVCGLRPDGGVVCWGGGQESHGQTVPPAGQTFTQLAAGFFHACGLRPDGTVACWGKNSVGQATPPTGAFVQIEADYNATCALRADGSAACWGETAFGQQTVPEGARFSRIAPGSSHVCGIQLDGTARCWGNNDSGRATPPAGVTFTAMDSGWNHTCGVTSAGALRCWGYNAYGQTNVLTGTNWQKVSAGAYNSCGVRTDGTAACWGDTAYNHHIAPAGTFLGVTGGVSYNCGLRTDGAAACWGYSGYGALSVPVGTTGAWSVATSPFDATTALRLDLSGGSSCTTHDAERTFSLAGVSAAFLSLELDLSCTLAAGASGVVEVAVAAADGRSWTVRRSNASCVGASGAALFDAGVARGSALDLGALTGGADLASVTVSLEGRSCSGSSSVILDNVALYGGCACPDADDDGVCDTLDRCAGADDATADPDVDGVCGAADICEGDDATGDADGDGICGDGDVCPGADDAAAAPIVLETFAPGFLSAWTAEYSANDTGRQAFRAVVSPYTGSDALRMDATWDNAGGENLTRSFVFNELPSAGLYLEMDYTCGLVSNTARTWVQWDATLSDGGHIGGHVTQAGCASPAVDVGRFITGRRHNAAIDLGTPAAGRAIRNLLVRFNVYQAGGDAWAIADDVELTKPCGCQDADGDGACNTYDRCPGADDATADPDGDALCGTADLCFGDDGVGDADADGRCNNEDLCPDADDADAGRQVLDAIAPGTADAWGLVADPAFAQLSVGVYMSCGRRFDGTTVCWGRNTSGESTPPAGLIATFLESGDNHTCALKPDGTIACWGRSDNGRTTPPAGAFTHMGIGSEHGCAVRADNSIACWGWNGFGQATPPTGSAFRQIAAGAETTCGLRADGSVSCWGNNAQNRATPPAGPFTSIDGGMTHFCGVKTDGAVACWGANDYGKASPPTGTFTAVAAGTDHTCGIRPDASVTCWGSNAYGQTAAPGPMTTISTYGYHTCGVRTNGTATCWGSDDDGRVSSVPLRSTAAVAEVASPSDGTRAVELSVAGTAACDTRRASRTFVLGGAPSSGMKLAYDYACQVTSGSVSLSAVVRATTVGGVTTTGAYSLPGCSTVPGRTANPAPAGPLHTAAVDLGALTANAALASVTLELTGTACVGTGSARLDNVELYGTCPCPNADRDGLCNAQDPCPTVADDLDPDGDGRCGAADTCIGDEATGDADVDGVCDDNDVCADLPDLAPPSYNLLDAFSTATLPRWEVEDVGSDTDVDYHLGAFATSLVTGSFDGTPALRAYAEPAGDGSCSLRSVDHLFVVDPFEPYGGGVEFDMACQVGAGPVDVALVQVLTRDAATGEEYHHGYYAPPGCASPGDEQEAPGAGRIRTWRVPFAAQNLGGSTADAVRVVVSLVPCSNPVEATLDNLVLVGTCPCDDADTDGRCDDDDVCPTDPGNDADGDGVCAASDRCPGADDRPDADHDTVPDCVDVCRGDDATGDADADGSCDDSELCTGDDRTGDADHDGLCDGGDPCFGAPDVDLDGDGVCDSHDLCLGDDATGDADADGICADIDPCVGVDDSDLDGVCDDVDLCPAGDDAADADADGVPDACDPCPVDMFDDSDADGVCDSSDACQNGDDALDADADYVPDACDPCPLSPTDDADGDLVCDDLDRCLGEDDNVESDGDGIPDACDACPLDPANDADADGVCGNLDACPGFDDADDQDNDSLAAGCDLCPLDAMNDEDADGVCGDIDQCFGGDDAADEDGDGVADHCDDCPGFDNALDADGDNVCDLLDVCPGFPDLSNEDRDDLPDGCDACPLDPANDVDDDGLCDDVDICRIGPNDDTDGDGTPDLCDPCPVDTENDQDADGLCLADDPCPAGAQSEDADGDDVADACDVCPGGDDALDADADALPDACDLCPNDAANDADADAVCGDVDACPGFYDALDADADGAPDACDVCPNDAFDDSDGDDVCDSDDVCPGGDDALDADADGTADVCDPCPADPANDEDGDGVCGDVDLCPNADDREDADGDAQPDLCDPCPLDAADDADSDGICGNQDICPGADDLADVDLDAVPDGCDACPLDVLDDQDGDALCDSDDVCPLDPLDDSDGDGSCDSDDLCPDADDTLDADGDSAPDACDVCPLDPLDDEDGDNFCADVDTCPGFDDVINVDGDLLPDACDACRFDELNDADADGVCGDVDACPGGDDALDADADGAADACDACPLDALDDQDGDGACDGVDPCPLDALDDRDGDGLCDSDDGCADDATKDDAGVCGCGVADDDSDGDGAADCLDGCVDDAAKVEPGACGCGVEEVDSDGDSTPDCLDLCPTDPTTDTGPCTCGLPGRDMDGDGVADGEDGCPLVNALTLDLDQDGCVDPAVCGVLGAMDGHQVASVSRGTATFTTALGQSVTAGAVYTLTVALGSRDGTGTNGAFGPARLEVLAGNFVVGGLTVLAPPVGTFTDRTVTGIALPAHGGLALRARVIMSTRVGHVDFDNVRVTADGAPVTVPNHDFELPAVSDGAMSTAAIPGWTVSGIGGSRGVLNPAGAAWYSSPADDDTACDNDPDSDGDGLADAVDACPDLDARGFDQDHDGCLDDLDADGLPDCLDGCPTDTDKVEPGACGCGTADDDSDGDGALDCEETCPLDAAKVEPGLCGCGTADDDSDGDGAEDCHELCPADPAKTEPQVCGCGVDEHDADADGAPDCVDACALDADKVEPGVCGCGVGDVDRDGDATPDCLDACPDDVDKAAPGACGCGEGEQDSDGDGAPDCVDGCDVDAARTAPPCGCGPVDPADDADGDGVADGEDACPDDDATSFDLDQDGCTDQLGCGEVGTMRGPAVASITSSSTGAFTQTLAPALTAGATYQVTVAIGARDAGGQAFGGYRVRLLAGTTAIGEATSAVAPTPGGFGDVTVTATPGAAYAGQPLRLSVGVRTFGQLDFDHVRATRDGAPLAVVNADFETPALAEGAVDTTSAVVGWARAGNGQRGRTNPAGSTAYRSIEDQDTYCFDGVDSDGDGLLDPDDACPFEDARGLDADADGCVDDGDGDTWPDCAEACPADADKRAPGVCGCGAPDVDSDADGVLDCLDPCPVGEGGDPDNDLVCGDADACPLDAANDADADGVCGDVDACPLDAGNDADADGVCGDVDACPLDPTNDADADGLCGLSDPCPGDAANDADADSVCGDVDVCPLDPDDDADQDGACGNVDVCPLDPDDDADSDGACANVDPCPLDPLNDRDLDGLCDGADACPADPQNDADHDLLCGNVDACPLDAANDADYDNLCGNVDACPLDAANDADHDALCADVDSCPLDAANDADHDAVCGDVDACPLDAANDADHDSVCGDVDACPVDAANDADHDGLCANVDTCPLDALNDADADALCGDVDACPLDAANDADGDGVCANLDACPLDFADDSDGDGACDSADPCPEDPADDLNGDGACYDATGNFITADHGGATPGSSLCRSNGALSPSWACTDVAAPTAAKLNQGVAVGDLNGDGRGDVVAYSDVCLSLFGAGFSCTAGALPTGVAGGIAYATILDVDNDGDRDIVAPIQQPGFSWSNVDWCLNNGAGVFTCTAMRISKASGDQTLAMQVGNLNNAGLLDVVYAQPTGTAHVGVCVGPATAVANTTLSCLKMNMATTSFGVGLADWNRDGRVDVITQGTTWENVGASFTARANGLPAATGLGVYNRKISAFDADSDGDKDLVYFNGSTLRYCRNTGAWSPTCLDVVATTPGLVTLEAADLDEDGATDLLYNATAGTVGCFGDGAGAFTCRTLVAGGAGNFLGVGTLP